MDFEMYLNENYKNSTIDYAIRADVREGKTVFYIYPNNKNGKNLKFEVKGNALIPIK
ncbi:hypothetical protein KM803_09565 [Clostridium tyrobutyricum]|jgi:hypothetical protein|uniref:hypothetical protein n=1 Tax=Clostridium tyrobutyricum TaxID=1519 RepID=UPI001C38B3A6|nr:hypothetical protein [Clostridium tyrobutyricum]MBV4431581.1 hypothetical protein [Clostridium tyrobutyricum]